MVVKQTVEQVIKGREKFELETQSFSIFDGWDVD